MQNIKHKWNKPSLWTVFYVIFCIITFMCTKDEIMQTEKVPKAFLSLTVIYSR